MPIGTKRSDHNKEVAALTVTTIDRFHYTICFVAFVFRFKMWNLDY